MYIVKITNNFSAEIVAKSYSSTSLTSHSQLFSVCIFVPSEIHSSRRKEGPTRSKGIDGHHPQRTIFDPDGHDRYRLSAPNLPRFFAGEISSSEKKKTRQQEYLDSGRYSPAGQGLRSGYCSPEGEDIDLMKNDRCITHAGDCQCGSPLATHADERYPGLAADPAQPVRAYWKASWERGSYL